MILRPPRTTRTDTLFPDTTRFRSKSDARAACAATTVFQAKRHQNMNLDFSTIVLVVVVLLVFLIVVKAIAIVPQQHAWVVERLGKYDRSEEHTSELQSLMRISYAVFCLKKKKHSTLHKNQVK